MTKRTSGGRFLFIDNLRIFLTALVVLHHLAITYGAPGGWYYKEAEADTLSSLLLSMFVATNQSFFMGFFFLISAFFTPPSFDKKGSRAFLKGRLIRLGIPLLVFFFILSPLTIYPLLISEGISFRKMLAEGWGFGFGPMWFVEVLLIFTFCYIFYRSVWGGIGGKADKPLPDPGDGRILLLAVILGLASFVVRIWLPVGWVFDPLNFQFPHFVQYILLLIVGVMAYRNNWMAGISYRRGLKWFLAAQAMIFILFPSIFLLGGAAEGNVDAFMGGLTWQSLAYSLWEQVTGLSLIVGLAGLFMAKVNQQGHWAKSLSASAYTVYIIHPLVLVLVCMALSSWALYPLLKFIVLAPVVLIICFGLAEGIRRLPGVDRVV